VTFAASAGRKDQTAQPAMRGIVIHPGVPHLGDRDRRGAHWQREAHRFDRPVPAHHLGLEERERHQRHEVGRAGDCEGGGEARDDDGDLAGEAEGGQRFVDGAARPPAPRGHNMAVGGVALGRNLVRRGERMSRAHDTDEAVLKQRLDAHLWSRLPQHADLQVDQPFAKRMDVLVGFGCEAQPYAGRLSGNRRDQPRREGFHKALVGADRKGALERSHIQRGGRGPQHGANIAFELAHPLAESCGMRCRHQPPAGADQQRVAGRDAQA